MNDLILAKVDQARLLLIDARDATEAKQVADMASAAEVYACRQHYSEEVIRYAHTIKVDALTLMGEFLKGLQKATGGDAQRTRFHKGTESPITLAESGISKKESMIAQALAEIREVDPELHEQVRTGAMSPEAARRTIRGRRNAEAKAEFESELRSEIEVADSRYRVDQGNCLEWFAAQPDDSIDLVFGSPPYEDARLYLEDGSDLGIALDTDAWVAWMVDVYRAALRCCTGLVAFVVEGRTKDYRWSASPALLMAALHQQGIPIRKPPIYHRVGIPGSGGPDWLRNDYEFVVCATRGDRLPWSENTAMGVPCVYEPGQQR
jgi:hypothetical protein